MAVDQTDAVIEESTLRHSRAVRPLVAILALAGLVAAAIGVGSLGGESAQTFPPPGGVTFVGSEPTSVSLLRWADAIAKSNGGKAVHVQAVLLPRDAGRELAGESLTPSRDTVYLVQVVGDRPFDCRDCVRPDGGSSRRGRVLQLTVTNRFSGGGLVVRDDVVDLSRIGKVLVLR